MRLAITLLVAATVSFASPDILPGKGGIAIAKLKKRTKERPRRSSFRCPAPVLPDDPSTPIEDSWGRHIERFLAESSVEVGVFVALEPKSGKIMVKAEHLKRKGWLKDPVTSASFPAASVFKVVTAAALLEGASVSPDTVVCYWGGRSSLEWAHLKDSPRRDKTCRDLGEAFARSTNAVFGKLAIRHLSAETLLEYAERFGFNRKVQIGGLWAKSVARKAKDGLDLGRMAAGFTNTSLAPLHGALIAAIVANGGILPSEVRVSGMEAGKDGSIRVVSEKTAKALQRMMEKAANEGTGRRYLSKFASLGKGGGAAIKTGSLSGMGLYNTWVVGFYPSREPEFAFAALISTSGGHPIKAGHLARFAIETYLRLKEARKGRS